MFNRWEGACYNKYACLRGYLTEARDINEEK